jgi:hypothetical protein
VVVGADLLTARVAGKPEFVLSLPISPRKRLYYNLLRRPYWY